MSGIFTKLAMDCREVVAIAKLSTEPGVLEFLVPVRTRSEANSSQREPWIVKAGRIRAQRQATAWVMVGLRSQVAEARTWPGWLIILTRVGRAELDDDNLRPSMKAIRDQVTQQLGIGKMSVPKKAHVKPRYLPNDRDPRLRFEYLQDVDHANEYAVRVRIERREP